MNPPLPVEIVRQSEAIAAFAREEGLDFPPTIFEMLTAEQMAQVAAYGGFPQRYPHWRFGMEYEQLHRQQGYGLSRILVEFAREPDAQLGYFAGFLTMGMILSLPLCAIGVWLLVRSRRDTA